MSRLKLWLLGPPRVELNDRVVTVKRQKALALLVYIAVSGESQRRDTLANLLWPDSSQSGARAGLRRDLSILNKALGGEGLMIDRETVGLRRGPDLWLDLEQFQRQLAECEKHDHPVHEALPACVPLLTEAVSLYRSDFLSGFTLPDCPDFDEWQFFQVEGLRQAFASALERLVHIHSAQGAYEVALPLARRWLALDPLHEPAHRRLMQAYAGVGQQAAALRQYQECVRLLQVEFGLPPAPETTQLYEAIKAGKRYRKVEIQEANSPASPPDLLPNTPTSFGPPRHNLPLQPTRFVGREEELASIAAQLNDPTCRLLTLAGPGGIGKTRLALQAAQNLVETPSTSMKFTDGVYFVPLASVSEADSLVSATAEALRFSFYNQVEPKRQLLDYLREKRMVLVLDNFEQLLTPPASATGEALFGEEKLEGTKLLTEILAVAPAVKILVTSREALNLQEEWFHPVAGMAYPEGPEGTETAEALEAYSAIQLFSQCARRVKPGFSLATEKEGVVRICRLVEGMPLGIELAAAWLKVLSGEAIARQIERDLDFLVTSSRNVPVRHRSMRAVFEYSWSLLTEAEQAGLRRLSVFRGGFGPDAAGQVAEVVLPGLATLVEKSLIQLSAPDRYQLHELLRQFVEEKLPTVPIEQEQVQERHSQYYMAFLGRQESRLKSAQQQEALVEIHSEIENVRAAWHRVVEQGQLEAIDHALSSLYDFYWTRSWFQEGQAAFKIAAKRLAGDIQKREAAGGKENRAQEKSEILLGRLLARQGAFCMALGQFESATELLQESLVSARRYHAHQEVIFSLGVLGYIAYWKGEYEQSKQLYQESLRLSQQDGSQEGVVDALSMLGTVAEYVGEFTEAKQYHQESLALSREIGRRDRLAHALDKSGTLAFFLGEYKEASQYYQESHVLFNEIGNRYGMALTLGGLGWVAWGLGGENLVEAKALVEESLARIREIGHQAQIAGRLGLLSAVANSLGDYQAALQYGLESRTIFKALGCRL